MALATNQLRVRAKRLLLPAGVVAALLIAITFIWNHHGVQAAGNYAAPLDGSSVSALTSLDSAMEAVASHVTPAVVNVAVTSRATEHEAQDGQDGQEQQLPPEFRRFFGPQGPQAQGPQIEHGIGSGIIISPDGYIVTNNHVVNGATQIKVTLNDRRVLPGKVVGTDKLTDLAVIKVNASNLPAVGWGDSTHLKPGQTVLAFGSPFGYFQFSVTRGIISALDRPNPYRDDPRKPGGFIQTDAAINPGNSGGPLVDARGEVVGINTFLISPSGTFSGMGFAIPSQIVRPTVETLIRDGKVSHGRIGIGIADVTPENAKFFDETNASGGVVTQVEPDSPGAKAGLQIGDVVTEIDGQKVSDAGELQVMIGQKQPGTKVTLKVLREGKSLSIPVTLEELGAKPGERSENSAKGEGKMRWGIGLSNLT